MDSFYYIEGFLSGRGLRSDIGWLSMTLFSFFQVIPPFLCTRNCLLFTFNLIIDVSNFQLLIMMVSSPNVLVRINVYGDLKEEVHSVDTRHWCSQYICGFLWMYSKNPYLILVVVIFKLIRLLIETFFLRMQCKLLPCSMFVKVLRKGSPR